MNTQRTDTKQYRGRALRDRVIERLQGTGDGYERGRKTAAITPGVRFYHRRDSA